MLTRPHATLILLHAFTIWSVGAYLAVFVAGAARNGVTVDQAGVLCVGSGCG